MTQRSLGTEHMSSGANSPAVADGPGEGRKLQFLIPLKVGGKNLEIAVGGASPGRVGETSITEHGSNNEGSVL